MDFETEISEIHFVKYRFTTKFNKSIHKGSLHNADFGTELSEIHFVKLNHVMPQISEYIWSDLPILLSVL